VQVAVDECVAEVRKGGADDSRIGGAIDGHVDEIYDAFLVVLLAFSKSATAP
jgi:hypothetical protein